jgi:hypothetical protein
MGWRLCDPAGRRAVAGDSAGLLWRRPVCVVAVVAAVAVVAFVAAVWQPGRADGIRTVVLFSFESQGELGAWKFQKASGELSPLHTTDGHSSLKVDFQGGGGSPGMSLIAGGKWSGGNWSSYRSLELDVFNPEPQPVALTIAVFDTPNRKGRSAKRRIVLQPLQSTHLEFELAKMGTGPPPDFSKVGEVAIFREQPMDPATLFFDRIAVSAVTMQAPDLSVAPRKFTPNGDGWEDAAVVRADTGEGMQWELSISGPGGRQVRTFKGEGALTVTWDGCDEAGTTMPLGTYELSLRVTEAATGSQLPRTICRVEITDEKPPPYLVWGAPVCEKVRRDSPVGTPVGPAGIKVAGARGEQAALQLVVSATAHPLQDVTVEIGDLLGAAGASVPSEAVKIYREAYVQVKEASHRDWEAGLWWPDPLPPWEPCEVSVEERHLPAWIEIAVPQDAAAGEYRGVIDVRLEGMDPTEVPVALTVWDFALPVERSLRTLFPLYLPSIAAQHLLAGLIVEGEGHEGTHAVKMGGEAAREAAIYQMLRPGLTADAEYKAGAWAKCDADRAEGALLQVKIIYKDKAVAPDLWERRFPAAAHDWQQEEIGFQPKGEERFILVRLEPGEGGSVWLDDAYLKPAEGENLIENGDFESGGPGRWQLEAPHLEGVQELHERYFWFLVQHGVCPEVPVGFDDERVQEFARQPSINSVRLPYRAPWQMGQFPAEDEELLRRAVAAAKEGGWLHKAFVYAVDEPAPEQYERCREVSAWVKQTDPALRFLLTEQFEAELAEAVDIWCPVLARVDLGGLAELQRQGEEFWWYTCANPRAPHPTFLVDDYGVAPRILPWMNARFNVGGLLYWQTTQWRAVGNPWEDPLTLPWLGANGDGSLLYPGPPVGLEGPVASLRLKLIREGIEDYEYLAMLRRLVNEQAGAEPQADGSDPGGKRVAELCQPLFTEFTDYNTDATALERVRAQVAEEIVKLSKASGGD